MTPQEYSRFLRLPTALERARRRVAQLEAEARRYGCTDLLGDKAA